MNVGSGMNMGVVTDAFDMLCIWEVGWFLLEQVQGHNKKKY